MSFNSYPILSIGSNIDLIRQAHNLLSTNVGDIDGLQTPSTSSIVDAINSLQVAYNTLVIYPNVILPNTTWYQGYHHTSTVGLNMIRVNFSDQLEIGLDLVPSLTSLDIGKSNDGFRNIYSLGSVFSNNYKPYSGETLNYLFSNTTFTISETSSTEIDIGSLEDALNIRSILTRVYTGLNYWEIDEDGHLVPDTDNEKDIGTEDVKIRKIYTNDLDASGNITLENVTITGFFSLTTGSPGLPLGGSCLWFVDTPPEDCAILNGQAISRADYSELATLFNTGGSNFKYGNGNGTTTFNLPDMRKCLPFGADSSQTASPDASTPGKKFGSLNHTHDITTKKHQHSRGTLATVAVNLDHKHSISGGGLNTGGTSNDHSHFSSLGFSATTDASLVGVARKKRGYFNGPGSDGLKYESVSDNGVDLSTNSGDNHSPMTHVASSHQHTLSGTASGNSGGQNSNHSHNISQAEFDSKISYPSSEATDLTSHSHSLSGVIGSTAGDAIDGDQDKTYTSTTNNPPSFAVHFIMRIR